MKNWFVVNKTDFAGQDAGIKRVNWGMTLFAYIVIIAIISIFVWNALTPESYPPLNPEQQQQRVEDYYDYKHGPRG